MALAKPTKETFRAYLKRKLKGNRGRAAALAKHCEVSAATVSRWQNGPDEPSFDNLDKIAEFFKEEATIKILRDLSDSKSMGITHADALEMLRELLPKSEAKNS